MFSLISISLIAEFQPPVEVPEAVFAATYTHAVQSLPPVLRTRSSQAPMVGEKHCEVHRPFWAPGLERQPGAMPVITWRGSKKASAPHGAAEAIRKGRARRGKEGQGDVEAVSETGVVDGGGMSHVSCLETLPSHGLSAMCITYSNDAFYSRIIPSGWAAWVFFSAETIGQGLISSRTSR